MDVDLEPVLVERRHRLGELGGRPIRQPTGVRRVGVGLDEEARAHLDHSVGEELDGARLHMVTHCLVCGELRSALAEPRSVPGPPSGLGPERHVRPRRQLTAASEGCVDPRL